MTQRFTRRAVSGVIASLLLISMTVTLSVVFYAYSAGLLGSLLPPPKKGYENPIIEMIAFSTDGAALLTVRNIGSGDSKVVSIYVDGVLKYSNPQGALISAGQARRFTLPAVSPTQHNFIVRTLDGGGVGVYGPKRIFVLGTVTGTTTVTGTSTITSGSTTTTTTDTFATTYTTTYTSTFTNTGPTSVTTTTFDTWTSMAPVTQTITGETSQTVSITTTITSCTRACAWRPRYTTVTTTLTSESTGPTTQTITTSTLSTGTTTGTSIITSTGSSTGTTTVTSTGTTTRSTMNPLWLILFIFLPWSTIRSELIEKPSLTACRDSR